MNWLDEAVRYAAGLGNQERGAGATEHAGVSVVFVREAEKERVMQALAAEGIEVLAEARHSISTFVALVRSGDGAKLVRIANAPSAP